MSVKTKLARQAVKTTAKHTAHGTASKFTRRPMRTVTLLVLGAAIGGLVGWLIGRSGSEQSDPAIPAPGPSSTAVNGSATDASTQTGAVS